MLKLVLFLFYISACFIGISSSTTVPASAHESQEDTASLRVLVIRQPELYAAFPSYRDIASFLNYVESYEPRLKTLNLRLSVDSLIEIMSPSYFEFQNAQILAFIVLMKGSDSLEAREFLLKCLKQSAFSSEVWSTYASLAKMNRISFIFFIREICSDQEAELFASYAAYELSSVVYCALISTLTASLFLASGFLNSFVFLLILLLIFYVSYQNFAF
jgi:hypothetical protein